MKTADMFVGAVAITVGILAVSAGLLNWDWPYRLGKARWVQHKLGRRAARIFYALLGLLLIAIGAAIAAGFCAGSQGAM